MEFLTYYLLDFLLVLLGFQLPGSFGIEFPNNVIGLPEVKCGENDITVMVNTLHGNPSHIYIVGRHEDPQCVTRNDNKITITHEQCGVTRERNSPRSKRQASSSSVYEQFQTDLAYGGVPVEGQNIQAPYMMARSRYDAPRQQPLPPVPFLSREPPTIDSFIPPQDIRLPVEGFEQPSDNIVGLNPAGIMYRLCVAVQLHPQFVTKVDRTFCARCLYTEGVNEYTREINVSPKGSTEVPVEFDEPMCTYTIRRGSPTGPEIKYAQVGEGVFHVWKCPSEMNGMLVQNCYVEDGQGNRILIVDQNGCGVDQYLLQTPEYTRDLTMAMQESHVFKFADKTVTRFTCQIKICIKSGNGCTGVTPPQSCPRNPGPDVPVQLRYRSKARRRFARSLNHRGRSGWRINSGRAKEISKVADWTISPLRWQHRNDLQIDVSEELVVLDDLDEELNKRLIDHPLVNNRSSTGLLITSHSFCVSQEAFVSIVVISVGLGLLGLIGIIVSVYLITRASQPTKSPISARKHQNYFR